MFQLLLLFGLFSLSVCLPRQYHFINENKNWAEAQRYCRENYADLATISNHKEEVAVTNLVKTWNSDQTWIGLYNDLNSWKWSLDEDSFYKDGERSFRNWYMKKLKKVIIEQPDYYGESLYCTAVSFNGSGKRTNENCGQAFPFVCYRTMSSTPSLQYYLINESKTWTEAQRYCRENYTGLATINNMEMNTLLNTVNGSYTGLAWIGLYVILSPDYESSYQKGGEDFRRWPSQPDNYNGQEFCVSMNSQGEWFDQSCTDSKAFVCYNGTTNAYVGIFHTMTWEEAQRFCRANHKDLASVRNATELQQILNITNGYDVWIGLYRNRLWSDQSNLTFTYWGPTTEKMEAVYLLDRQNQLCTAVDRSGGWTDENCFASFPFICYSSISTVMGLQLKIKANGNLLYSEIEGLVLEKLGQELSRLSRNITLNVRNIREVGPGRSNSAFSSTETKQ